MKCVAHICVLVSLVVCEGSASCGSASCPLHEPVAPGLFTASLIFEYIDQNSIFVGSHQSSVGAIQHDHDEIRTINRLAALRLGVGVTGRFRLAAEVPWVDRFHNHRENETGEIESWYLSGLGDLRLTAEGILLDDNDEGVPFLAVTAGMKFPTGTTDAVNTNGERADVTIQPGSGSYDLLLGADFRVPIAVVPGTDGVFADLPLIAGISYRVNGKGTDDYRFGNVLVATVGSRYRMTEMMALMVQINGRFEGFADVGRTQEPGENTGGVWLYASPGVRFSFMNSFAFLTYVQIPLYRDVHGIQQVSDVNFHVALLASLD